MKKNYTNYFLQLFLIVLFATATFNAYSKSNSNIGFNNSISEYQSLFVKVLVEDEVLSKSNFVFTNIEDNSKNDVRDTYRLAQCQAITVYLDATGNANITPEDINPANSGANFSLDRANFTCLDIVAPVTVTVTDSTAPSTSCTATVTVQPYTTNAAVTYTKTPNVITVCDFETIDFTAVTEDLGSDSATYEWYVNDILQPVTGENFSYNSWTAPSDVVKVVMTVGLGTCAPKKEYASTIAVNEEKPVSFSISGPSSVCEGVNATFNIANAVNTGTPNYQWKLNGNNVGTNSSSLTLSTTTGLTLAGPNLVTLELTSTIPCATPSGLLTSNSLSVQVNPLPSLVTSPGYVCTRGQTSVNLNTLVTTDAGATVTFHSTAGGATNDSGVISNLVSPTSNATYYVRSTLGTGCFVTGSIPITIDQGPAMMAVPDRNQTICLGNSFDLSTIASGDSGPNFVRTYYPRQNAANASVEAISPIVSPTSLTTYYVRIDNIATGCFNTNPVTINVNPLPSLAIVDGAICVNGSIDLNTLVTTNGTKTFYANQANANAGTPTISATVSPASQTSYWVRTQLGTGCFQVGEIVVSVNALPTLTVENGAVCAGSQTSINLNNLVTTNGNTVTFHTSQANANSGASSITATVSPNSQTTYYVRSEFNNGCYSTAPITISINPLPTVNVGANVAICNGGSTTLTASGASTYSWNNGGGTGASITVSPATTTTYTVTGTDANGCSNTANVTVTVSNAVTISPNSGNNNQNICAGSSIAPITYTIANGGSGAGATVTTNPGTGITLAGSYNSSTGIYTVTGTTTTAAVIGTYNFTVTPTGCGATGATAQAGTIRIFKNPITLPVITGPTGVCPSPNTNTYSVTADPNILTYTWNVPSGMVINSGQGTNSIVVKVNSVGSNNSPITLQSTNPCGTVNSSLTVSTGTNATVNAGPDQYICAGDTSVTFDGSVGGAVNENGNGNKGWTWSSSAITFPNNQSSLSGTYNLNTPAIAGSVINVTISTNANVSGCGGQLTDVMQIFVRETPTASVISNGPICTGTIGSVTFSGTPNTTITFTVGTGGPQTILLGAGNGTTATSNFNTPAALNTNTNIIIQSIAYTDPRACQNTYISNKPTATIVVNPLNTVTPGNTISVCQSATPVAVALTGASVGNGAQGQWTIESGGGTLSPASGMTSNPATVTYTPAVNYTGNVVLRLTTNQPGTCPVVSATRTITVNEAPTVFAGTQGNICQSSTPTAITLNGASVGGGNGNTTAQWTITQGGGTLNPLSGFSANPQNVTYTPAVNYFGPVTLTLTTNAPGACSSVSSTRVFNIDQQPTVEAGPNNVLCQTAIQIPITLTGASIGGGDGNTTAAWSITSGSGQLSTTAQTSSPQSVTFTPSANYTGTVTLTLTTNAPGACSLVSDTRNIIIEPAATVNAGSNVAICEGESVTLNGSIGGSASSASWSAPTGSFVNNAALNTIYTPSITNGTVRLTLLSNEPSDSCPAVSSTVDITVRPIATVTVNADFDVCSTDTNIPISADLSGGSATSGNWTSSSGNSGGFANSSANSTTYTPNASDINAGTVTLTFDTNDPDGNGPCDFVSDSVTITIYDTVSIDSQPSNIGVCASDSASISVGASGDNLTYQWYKVNAGGDNPITGATSNILSFASASIADAGTYYVIVKGNAACGTSGVTSLGAQLTVNQDISITQQPVAVTQCVGNTATFTVVANGTIGSYLWKKGGAGFTGGNQAIVTSGNTNTITLEIQNIATGDAGNYSLQLNSNGGTCDVANTNSVALTVTEIPTATISYAGSPFCSDSGTQTVTLNGTHAYSGGTYAAAATTGGPNLNINADGDIDPSNSDPGTYTITYTIPASGGCPDDTVTTSVTINALPEITAFTYANATYCASDVLTYAPNTVTVINGIGGSYSASAGLTIDSSTGEFSPDGVTPGTYTITYTVTNPTNCSTVVDETFDIIIQAQPDATFSYAAPSYCIDGIDPTPTTTQSGGVFSGTNGLVINASTGEIDLSASTAVSHTVYYTFAAVNGGCAQVQASQPITISPLPVISGEAPVCVGSNINLSPSTGGTWVSNNPTRATINSTTGVVTGVASGSATFTYTDTATGCQATSSSVSVNPLPILSGVANLCVGETITLSPTSGGTWTSSNTSIATITNSGLVTGMNNGSVNFTFTTTGTGCVGSTASITVYPLPTIVSPTSICVGSTTNITPSSGGTWTSSDPTKATINNTGSLVGIAAGSVTITFRNTATNCTSVKNITITPKPIGGILSFGSLGKLFLICENPVTGSYTTDLTLSGITGTVVRWQYRSSTATTWSTVLNTDGSNFTGTVLPRLQIASLVNNVSTIFRVEISSGVCAPNVYSDTGIVSVIPSDITPSPVTVSATEVCINDEVTLSSETGYGETFGQFEGGAFGDAAIDQGSNPWRFRDEGVIVNYESSANNTRPNRWNRTQRQNFDTANLISPYTLYNPIPQWNTTNAGQGHFSVVSGDNSTTMETPIFALTGLDQAIVTFDQAFNLTPGASILVEISTDGGNTYGTEPILYQNSGPISSGNFNNFGNGTAGVHQITIDLGDYLGYPNLRIRFKFDGARVGDVWAVDNIVVPEGPRGITQQWNDTTDPENPIFIGNSNTENWTPSQIGSNVFQISTLILLNSAGDACTSVQNSEDISVYVFDNYTSTAIAPPAEDCGKNSFQLGAQLSALKQGNNLVFPTPDGYGAPFWEVVGPAGYSFSNPDPSDLSVPENNPNAIFNAPNEGTYTLRWRMDRTATDGRNNNICPPVFNSITINVQNCIALDFDGVNDFIDLGDHTGNYSIEAWIRPETSTGTIISTKNREIRMSDLPTSIIPNTRWYHIAVDSNGKLYVDGIDTNTSISAVGTDRSFVGAKWSPPNAINHFSGWIEEVRIWNGNISQDQIRFLMNQRLQTGANIGVEIPQPAPGLPYTSLVGYYKLLRNNILNGGYTPNLAGAVDGKLRNMTTLQENTAPLPYTSRVDGQQWAVDNTWTNFQVWDAPNSLGVDGSPIDWNIVRTSHNIASGDKDITVLGLISNTPNKVLTIADPSGALNENNDGQGLRVTHYLKLDGNIDLVGESQLIQDEGSILDVTSSGKLERDQQGTTNLYNYNYWSSPVSPVNTTANNTDYSIGGVLRDGTNSATPLNLQWTTAHNAIGSTSPKTMSSRWLYSYRDFPQNSYSSWVDLDQNSTIKVGLGFTMKGSGAATTVQNYVFVGKPNNGTITNSVSANYQTLIGNPYPSAIDADEFIRDNIPGTVGNPGSSQSIDGSLYFWEHYTSNTTHVYELYEGSYAIYNLSGGLGAVIPDGISGAGTSSKVPGQFIPVGQSFFVTASPSGGDIKFHNDQRFFVREAAGSSVFMRQSNPNVSADSNEDPNDIQRLRLKFSSNGLIRPLLLGFTPDNAATDGFDYGYDALFTDEFPNDMFWSINGDNYIIQGVGAYDEEMVYPLNVNISNASSMHIELTDLENFDSEIDVFVYDSLLDTYHQINTNDFTMTLDAGNYDNRFFLTFTDNNTLSVEEIDSPVALVNYLMDTEEIYVKTPSSIQVKQVYLINLLGQTVKSWNMTNMAMSNEIRIPANDITEGTYIVKVETDGATINKKVIIKY